MARQDINHGTVAGDGTGENLFLSFEKCNANFTELYQNWVNLASTANGDGASDVGIEDSAGNFTATNVEAALAEILSKLADTAASEGASLVGVQDAATNFTATDVEGVLAEIISTLASTANGDGAATVGVEDSATNFTATTVEGVLAEIISTLASTANGAGAATVGVEDAATNFTGTTVEAVLAEIISTLASTANGDGASTVGIEDSGAIITATTVEGALAEIAAEIDTLALTTNGNGASLIGVEDADDQLTATDAEGAIEEVAKFAMPTPAPSGNLHLEFSAIAGSSVTLPTNSGAVRLHALGDCLVEFGDSSVSASTHSMYMAHGTEIFGVPSGATHIAVKGAGESGALHVTGLDAAHRTQLTTNAVLPVQAGSSSVALPAGRMVRLFAMTDCYIEFGDGTVTADETSLFFEAGTEVMRVPSTATHIAAVRYALNGGLYITGVN